MGWATFWAVFSQNPFGHPDRGPLANEDRIWVCFGLHTYKGKTVTS
jgi:hypothetical protein